MAYVGALVVVIAIRSLALGQSSPTDLFATVLRNIPDSRVGDRILEINELHDDRSVADVAGQFGSSGYVVESVPLALYAARSIDRLPLEVVLRRVIEAGGDTDTIASMSGQIAGAWSGAAQIPSELIELMPKTHDIERISDEFTGTLEQ